LDGLDSSKAKLDGFFGEAGTLRNNPQYDPIQEEDYGQLRVPRGNYTDAESQHRIAMENRKIEKAIIEGNGSKQQQSKSQEEEPLLTRVLPPVKKSMCQRILDCLQSLGLIRRGGTKKRKIRGGMSRHIREFISLHPELTPFLQGQCPMSTTPQVEEEFLHLLQHELLKKGGKKPNKKYSKRRK
jgi:hypothetical protein